MFSREDGFSLTELIVAMSVFLLVIAAATGMFIPLIRQFKQQSTIAETNIEGTVGLELLRNDIEHAGYGLPWSFQNSNINFNEASISPAADYNDGSPGFSPANPPRAIMSGDGVTFNGADYLVIKSTVVASNDTSERWSYITAGNNPRSWNSENIDEGNGVIVIKPKAAETKLRQLVMSGSIFSTTYVTKSFPATFSPTIPSEAYLIYGVSSSGAARLPFNRADYYINRPAHNMPQRCASNTGVLYKATFNQAGDTEFTELALMDCVADLQIAYGVDITNPPDGIIDCYTNSPGKVFFPVDAQNTRDRLREVRVYILSQEGRYDITYNLDLSPHTANLVPDIGCPTCIRVGEGNPKNRDCSGEKILGRDFDLTGIPDWQHYRWKVYTLVVRPDNLR
jgi:prepilin-type N-terminal cleavage/methylation domain-containing protein